MEDRVLLAASLAPIANLTVPAQQGYALPLEASATTTDAQTFSVTRISGSSDIVASIIQGPFWTVNVNYTDPTTPSNSFHGPMTFQLFEGTTVNGKTVPLTTNTVSHITEFTNDGYYTSPTTGNATSTKLFNRITNLTITGSNFFAQGGGPDATDTGGNSGQPNTPFPNENFQQLAFTGTDQLAMANAGVTATGTNDTQFFITTSNLNSILGYNYTIFGQMVSGQTILGKMIAVPTNSSNGLPNHNVNITAVSLSSTNPNGVALIDSTRASPGDTAVFQVKATDPTDGTSVSEDFVVTVGSYTGPHDPIINFKPLASPVAASVADGRATSVTLAGRSVYPDATLPYALWYSLVSQPSHGTISHFNQSLGTFVYTPKPGFTGTESFRYVVQETGPEHLLGTGPAGLLGTTTSNPTAVTITVTPRVRKSPPLVRLTGVRYATNQQGDVTEVFLAFSGPLNATAADDTATYSLFTQAPNGSFGPPRGDFILLRTASYNNSRTVTLLPWLPFSLRPRVEVVVRGAGPSALLDSLGRPIEGTNGKAGGNAVAILAKRP